MNSKTTPLAVIFGLLFVTLLYIVQSADSHLTNQIGSEQPETPQTRNEERISQPRLKLQHRASSAEFEQERASAASQRKKLEERVNMLTAKSAARRTAEDDQKMVEFILKDREPRYRGLFNLWKLDGPTREFVLEVIRERELRRKEWEYQRRKSGVDGLRMTFSDPISEKALVTTLNEVQVRQLGALERMLTSESIAKSKSLLSQD